jgi:hypothetical protein
MSILDKSEAYYMTGERVWKSQLVDKAIEDAIAKHQFTCTIDVHKTTAHVIQSFGTKCLGYRVKKASSVKNDRTEITVHWSE